MNVRYKKGGKYQIMKAIREDEFIGSVFGTVRGGDYRLLRKLLYKLDNSEIIRRSIHVVEPKTRNVRDYYGNYKEYFPDEEKSSKLYHELEWLLLDGGSMDANFRRSLYRKYHVSPDIVDFCYEWAQGDLAKLTPYDFQALKAAEASKRLLLAKINNRGRKQKAR
jgi:hypothetical protein